MRFLLTMGDTLIIFPLSLLISVLFILLFICIDQVLETRMIFSAFIRILLKKRTMALRATNLIRYGPDEWAFQSVLLKRGVANNWLFEYEPFELLLHLVRIHRESDKDPDFDLLKWMIGELVSKRGFKVNGKFLADWFIRCHLGGHHINYLNLALIAHWDGECDLQPGIQKGGHSLLCIMLRTPLPLTSILAMIDKASDRTISTMCEPVSNVLPCYQQTPLHRVAYALYHRISAENDQILVKLIARAQEDGSGIPLPQDTSYSEFTMMFRALIKDLESRRRKYASQLTPTFEALVIGKKDVPQISSIIRSYLLEK